MIGTRVSLFVAMLVLWTAAAGAHQLRPAIVTLEFTQGGELALTISLNLEAAIAGIGAGHENTSESPAADSYDRFRALQPEALGGLFEGFSSKLLERVSLEADGKAVALEVVGVDIPEVGDLALPRVSELRLKGAPPSAVEHLVWRLDSKLGNSVIRLRDAASGAVLGAEFVIAGEASGPFSVQGLLPQGPLAVAARYLRVGFIHIVPKGLDHILFVVGLFLLSTRLKALLWQVTAFTLAHTVSLGLGMLDIVRLSPAIVEPLIAASILYVAVENILTDRLRGWRPAVVFGFGLLHGLGFAGVLQEIGTAPGQFLVSLLAFNLGVELGQLAVITACFLAVGWWMKQQWYRRAVVVPSSLAIGFVAGIWILERTGLL